MSEKIDYIVFDIWNKVCGPIYNDNARFMKSIEDKNWKPESDLSKMKMRDYCTKYFAWAVPDYNVISKIAKYKKIIEIGAGSGYWASLIKAAGALDVVCYDTSPWRKTYFDVHVGSHEKIALHPEHILFLCWPDYKSDIVTQCLDVYKGDTLLYVGEQGGCTAWCDRLDSEWRSEYISIPQWQHIHDELIIFTRKPK